jgi:surface protein
VCSLSLSVATPFPLLCFLNIRQFEFHRITLTRFVIFVVDWSFFSLFHPLLLAVFARASVFNQDVSKWNTGAVTNMGYSKCTLSLSL